MNNMNPTLKEDLALLKKVMANERRKLKDRLYHSKNKDKYKLAKQKWYLANITSEQNRHFRRRYGIDANEYNTMLARQNNACAICKRPSTDFTQRMHVEHCHKSGKVRAICCVNCNRLIGACLDNITILSSAIDYLKHHAI